ncbi:imidazoleglycerol-phosphate dehydratase [ANME-1 cluster archaeon ex4572_4]|nr:imidazoleglycerol-phosphate dehydratase [Methanophagales archaeon]OYT66745.1 MAG: imidazoleglycerol-phosphate dehydratase [ANME-1 cluster archaeon ex4572_4]PXF51935.1 MAG: imidazoleglycerol-phosphate dehydratase [Methanophagales archaeon]HDN68845.1 imidazoleglycerol-phosphate dehydratase [Methanomicrobia archaeon]
MRTAGVKRKTEETEVEVELNLDGVGRHEVSTTIKFLDHMLAAFSRHGFFDLVVRAEGDLSHHIVEDTAIVLGKAFKKALGGQSAGSGESGRERSVRFGSAAVPMDESLARCAVDIGGIGGEGRSYSVFEAEFGRERVEDFCTEDIPHFFHSFATHANFTLHLSAKGENEHHKVEAIFKALGIALDHATRLEARREGRK